MVKRRPPSLAFRPMEPILWDPQVNDALLVLGSEEYRWCRQSSSGGGAASGFLASNVFCSAKPDKFEWTSRHLNLELRLNSAVWEASFESAVGETFCDMVPTNEVAKDSGYIAILCIDKAKPPGGITINRLSIQRKGTERPIDCASSEATPSAAGKLRVLATVEYYAPNHQVHKSEYVGGGLVQSAGHLLSLKSWLRSAEQQDQVVLPNGASHGSKPSKPSPPSLGGGLGPSSPKSCAASAAEGGLLTRKASESRELNMRLVTRF